MSAERNPYAEFSTLAVGERFVGRSDERRDLLNVVAGRASRAIVGLPRVGKSSLARTALEEARQIPGVDVLWIDVGTIDPTTSLISALAEELDDPATYGSAHAADHHARLKSILRERRRRGRRVVAVLDEFDAIRTTSNATLTVRRLRELVIDPSTYGLTLIFVCRRRLETIEERIPDLSNLANACPTIRLRSFSDDELAEMIARGFPQGITLEDRVRLATVTGRYPILAEQALMLLCEGAPVDTLDQAMRPATAQLLTQLEEFLGDAGLWDSLLEVARTSLCPYGSELDQLLDYGVITELESGAYRVPFSALKLSALQQASQTRAAWVTDA